jgi:D-galactarolactone cycloisomerase
MRALGQILERVTPLVVGQDPFGVERIWQDVFALTYTSVRGIPTLAPQRRQLVTAMSAIDIALRDLMGKATGRPVHALLGGALRPRVPAYVTGFYYRDGERPDDLRREAALYLEHGYRTVKVKVAGRPSRPNPACGLTPVRYSSYLAPDAWLRSGEARGPSQDR